MLGLRDDGELLEYVSRGREARQLQQLATADQAMEREKRVALAHRQACTSQPTLPTYLANLPYNLPCQPTVPAYPAPQLPCSYAAHVGRMSPPQAAVRFVLRLGRGFNTWRQHCAEAAALRAAVLRAAVAQRPRQVAAWERWSEAAAAAAVKEAKEAVRRRLRRRRSSCARKGISIGRLLGRRRAPPPAGGAASPGRRRQQRLGGAWRRRLTRPHADAPARPAAPRGSHRRRHTAAAAAATPDDAADVGVGVGDGGGGISWTAFVPVVTAAFVTAAAAAVRAVRAL